MNEEKEKEVSSYEAKRYCIMKGFGFEPDDNFKFLEIRQGSCITQKKLKDQITVSCDSLDDYPQLINEDGNYKVASELAESGVLQIIEERY